MSIRPRFNRLLDEVTRTPDAAPLTLQRQGQRCDELGPQFLPLCGDPLALADLPGMLPVFHRDEGKHAYRAAPGDLEPQLPVVDVEERGIEAADVADDGGAVEVLTRIRPPAEQ